MSEKKLAVAVAVTREAVTREAVTREIAQGIAERVTFPDQPSNDSGPAVRQPKSEVKERLQDLGFLFGWRDRVSGHFNDQPPPFVSGSAEERYFRDGYLEAFNGISW